MAASAKSSPRSRPLKLEDLNDGCLCLAVDELRRYREHYRPKSLHSFSAVCRRLRQITSPVIFARSSTPLVINIRDFIPETLWKFISVLSFTGERSADTVELSVEHLERAMPSFEVLESVRFHEIFGSSIALAIPAVLAAPHLRALHVIDQSSPRPDSIVDRRAEVVQRPVEFCDGSSDIGRGGFDTRTCLSSQTFTKCSHRVCSYPRAVHTHLATTY
ncbi:uncharacterized protein STEHIDRAFT_118685 [Stereum hirsutum FP-91666 SS1]|uniref:uncharacterized protein n=1 Tax=Stereum hirsutum (strain FP-91666) TaxID=721885 RepID=UPI000440EC80|nr:uncharacterized protein STEHIDRAFT_118685 [Stereum hirsutum FP-91666 SS1]EIM89462.1 hypothetical protein STEHIDRAFT_118685 [Stereum hirsutum FP-91666 SS1]